MTSVLVKIGDLETDTHTGRTPYEDKGRGQSDASTSQGKAKIVRQPPEARGEA